MSKKKNTNNNAVEPADCLRLYEAEKRINQDMSRFLAGVSHEIRNQAASMLGVVEMLGDFDLEGRAANYVKVLGESAASLLGMVTEILDYSKMEAGKFKLDSVPFDPAEVLERTLEPYRIQAEAKGVQLNLEVDAGVPLAVRGDPRRLAQVVGNLASNALLHTDKGRIDVGVDRVSEPGKEVMLVIKVSDTGVGVPADMHEELFRSYVQVEGETTGTGLGLSICRGLARLMHGDVTIESMPGKGSCFTFTAAFKLAKPSDLDNTPPVPVPERVRKKVLRFLLAEDNEMNREYMSYFLQGRGHTVVEAENGRVALDILSRGGIDVVLLDMRMPILDGMETIEALRCGDEVADPEVPVIGLTAHAMPEDRDRALKAGMDEYMVKPVDMNRLESIASALAADRVPKKTPAARPRSEPGQVCAGRSVPGRLGVLFAAQTPSVMEAIRSTARNGDMENCRERAHFLAGSAIAVREGRLVELCRAVERGAAAGDKELVLRLLEDLDEEYAVVIGRLKG